jgi:hypothetical protein
MAFLSGAEVETEWSHSSVPVYMFMAWTGTAVAYVSSQFSFCFHITRRIAIVDFNTAQQRP